MSGPSYHGRTHGFKLDADNKVVGYGTDPIAFPDLVFPTSGGGITWPSDVLADPTVWSAWTMDDVGTNGQLVGPPGPASGSAADAVGGRDLALHQGLDHVNVVVQFEEPGPFVGDPSWNSIYVAGQQHSNDYTTRFERTLTAPETAEWLTSNHSFTVEMFWKHSGSFGAPEMNLLVVGNEKIKIAHTSAQKITFTRNGVNTVTSSTSLPDVTWCYIACVYDGTNIMLYMDGVAEGSTASGGSITPSSYDLSVGSDSQGPGYQPAQGFLSWIVIHDGALDAATIAAKAGLISSEPNTAAGKVWTAAGDGTESWEYPTIEVTY